MVCHSKGQSTRASALHTIAAEAFVTCEVVIPPFRGLCVCSLPSLPVTDSQGL